MKFNSLVQLIVKLEPTVYNISPLLASKQSQKFNSVRTYARFFPPEYQIPKSSRLHYDEMEDEELEQNKHSKYLPATTNDNCSVFYDESVEKFRNLIMIGGDKILARKLLEKTFYQIKKLQYAKYVKAETDTEKEEIIIDPMAIFHSAVANCTPLMTVNDVKKGGKVYQVPVPLTVKRARWMSMKWLIEAGRDKGTKEHLHYKLSKELIHASNNEGRVIRKKIDLHKLCETNRAYAHFMWA